jgi:hypothetical protein
MEAENKKKYAHWFHPSTIKLVEDMCDRDNCKSRSEYIEKAVQFYSGYISEKDASLFLSRSLVSVMRGMLDDTENRMATLLFKQAVEISMLMNVLAAMTDVDDETLRKLRIKCVEDAKRSNGSISFAAVAKSHRDREHK